MKLEEANPKPGINVTQKVSDCTPNFTGREWVFQKIYDWLFNPNASRYFLLTGKPGSGKTAIATHLIQTHKDICCLSLVSSSRIGNLETRLNIAIASSTTGEDFA
ncbi:MAG: ATP-binding protein [Scytonema hyalinum WJT4-NPBG1]|jgi:Cdc6-like AAA superfamily ATPase|nr:ATP-binding protein [Scytonema hyalinum WJT4-NPBG1]